MLLFGAGARTPNNSCPVDMPSDGFRPRDVSLTGGLKGSFKGTGTASRPSKEPFSVSGPQRPNVAFGASDAPKAAFGASDATKAALGRSGQAAGIQSGFEASTMSCCVARVSATY